MGNFDHGTTYMRVGGDDGELRPWHYIYVYGIESRLIRRRIFETSQARSAEWTGHHPAPHPAQLGAKLCG